MARISEDEIERLRVEVSLVESSGVKLAKRGADMVIRGQQGIRGQRESGDSIPN